MTSERLAGGNRSPEEDHSVDAAELLQGVHPTPDAHLHSHPARSRWRATQHHGCARQQAGRGGREGLLVTRARTINCGAGRQRMVTGSLGNRRIEINKNHSGGDGDSVTSQCAHTIILQFLCATYRYNLVPERARRGPRTRRTRAPADPRAWPWARRRARSLLAANDAHPEGESDTQCQTSVKTTT